MTQINKILFLTILITFCSCIFPKTKKEMQEPTSSTTEFTNKSMTPLIENCRNKNTEACFHNTLSDFILNRVKEENLNLTKDTLQVLIRINQDGSTSLLENKTTNPLLRKVSSDVLTSLPQIEPAYSGKQQEYVTTSYSWFIIIENNKVINRFKE